MRGISNVMKSHNDVIKNVIQVGGLKVIGFDLSFTSSPVYVVTLLLPGRLGSEVVRNLLIKMSLGQFVKGVY